MAKARLTVDLDPRLHSRLKIASARRGTSMREYLVEAIEHRLAEDAPDILNAETDPVLADLWDNDDDAIYDDL
jgi:predicted DNA-binding protein